MSGFIDTAHFPTRQPRYLRCVPKITLSTKLYTFIYLFTGAGTKYILKTTLASELLF